MACLEILARHYCFFCLPCRKYHKKPVVGDVWWQLNGVGDSEIGKN